MTEQEKHVNHFLTLYIGECYHDWEAINPLLCNTNYHCINCKKESYTKKINPDFYQPNDFDRLRKWMEENEPTLWEEYLYNYLYYVKGKSAGKRFNSVLDPSNLFEFLKEHREEWENVQDESRVVGYQHPAAAYLDNEA